MKIYFLFFAAAFTVDIIMIISGIVFRKRLSPVGVVYIPLSGIIIAAVSVIMCLCLGWFMR